MYELLTLLQQVPRPIKYLFALGLAMPLAYAIVRGLGIQKYWWLVIGGMILIAIAVWAVEKVVKGRDKSKGKEFAGELERDSQKVGASKQEVRAALKDLADQWGGALKSLQATGLNIYSLPWYLLIGEPQSGKSTTLKNSGLEFPVGNEGLSGSGGTRNCDWWFANEAVILDTAGRFTFNEEAAPDQAEWSTFLRLLKKHRRYCPINGVLVVVPCTSLLEDAPEEMDRKAANIRTKLLHLQRVLEIRFPVFIMVTKADRILGFSEFFSKLDPVDQRQLFGWSNPESADKPWDPNAIDSSFEDVVTRVHKLRLKFSATDENVQNVDRLFVFPDELRALKEPLKRYLAAIFQQTRYDEPFHFRGYYISSGVQQGKPIARATRELLGSAGEGIVENLESIFKRSRAFFIKDFYEKKVFPEQGLIAKTRAAEKLERQTIWLVRGLSAALILLVLCGMIPAYIGLKRIVEPIRVTVRNTQECMEDKPQPCTLAKSYRYSKEIYDHRVGLTKHPFIFAMFFRSGKRGELDDLLMRIEQKVYLARVVTPLMKDYEARTGAMSWEAYPEAQQYFGFREALLNHLRWSYLKNVTALEPGVRPAATPKELKVSPFIVFARDTKGLPASPRSKEVDDWVKAIGDDPGPDQILAQVLPGAMPANGEWWEVPDLGKPVKRFEEYWTVENLARWDFRLWVLLQKYAQAYSATLQIEDPRSVEYLSRVSLAGKDFKSAWEETTKHLATLRPGSKEFPGFTVEDWQTKLDEDYQKLMLYEAAAPTLVNDNRLQALKTNLATEKRNLDARLGSYAYLVEPDPAALGQKMKWTKPAEGISPMVADLVVFADLAAFKVAVMPEKIVADALAKSAAKDQEAGLESFRMQQEEAKKKAVANVALIPSIPPEHVSSWQVSLLQRFVGTTGDLALVYRVVPSALEFLKKSIAPGGLPENVIFQPLYARAIVPLGVRFMSFAEGSSAIAGRQDVEQLTSELAETELDYLKRYIDRNQAPRPRGGGGGFGVPYGALQARSWPDFQSVITRWNPEGGGGDSGPAPVDMSGALTFEDVQSFGNSSRRLNAIIKYFQDRMQPVRRPSRGAQAPPEVVQAAQTFKQTVSALSDQPLKAWKQLSLAQEGASLRAYHSFSRSAAVRRSPWGRQLVSVENRGANLVRDAIRPGFQQVQEPISRKLQSTCQGQFPFISGRQLAQDRQAYANLTSLRFSGGGSNVNYNLELPSIGQTQFSGILTELGALCDEYALDPILWGGEPEFDFVGEPPRSWFHVGRRWERWVYGGPGGGGAAGGQLREHKVDIRPLQFNPLPGRRFVGDRVGAVTLFDRNTMVRPSTDAKAGRFAPTPFVWRLAPAEAPMPILGRNEESGTRGWTGNLDVRGGPLRFYYLIRVASEPRDRLAFENDPEKLREKEKFWTIRLIFPNAETVNEPLEGLFELVFDEPVPPILGN